MVGSRRKFLKYVTLGSGTGAGIFSWWLATSHHRAARMLRRMLEDAKREVAPVAVVPSPAKWSDNSISLCWIGHATVLINFYGVRILTDPALRNRVGVSLGPLGTAGIKRYIAPALGFREIGRVDLLLFSHAHMDHMDLPTVRRFAPEIPAITASSTDDLLRSSGRTSITEMRWGDRQIVRTGGGEVEIEAFEVKHWGQRWPSEMPRGYNGYVLRRGSKALIFGGDTALTSSFAQLRSEGPFAAAIMPIGAYQPWIRNHCTPEQALAMANSAGANYIVPVHHQTFRLSEEPMTEPIERLKEALSKESGRLAIEQPGQTFVCPG